MDPPPTNNNTQALLYLGWVHAATARGSCAKRGRALLTDSGGLPACCEPGGGAAEPGPSPSAGSTPPEAPQLSPLPPLRLSIPDDAHQTVGAFLLEEADQEASV